MGILYTLIAIFGVVFLESFLVALCDLRILFLVSVVAFKKINWRYLCIAIAISSIVLDVVYHYVLGTNLILIAIPMLLLLLFSLFVPLGQSLPGYAVKLGIFVFYNVLLVTVPNFLLEGVFGQLSWAILLGILVKSCVSVLLCFVADLVWDRFRKKEDGTKLRLK